MVVHCFEAMSKKTNAAKQKALPVPKMARRKLHGRRPNPAFGNSADSLLLSSAGSILGRSLFGFLSTFAPQPQRWHCGNCCMTLSEPPGVPQGFVPFCPGCKQPMVRPGVGVTFDGQDSIDAEFEDVTHKRIEGPKRSA